MDAAASAALYSSHVLKDGDAFLVCNGYGDFDEGSTGLFLDDTRLLSVYRLRISDTVPSLLSAAVAQDNVSFSAHLTNRQLQPLGDPVAPEGLLHIHRTRFLHEGRMHERIVFTNYGNRRLAPLLRIAVGADFRDMFEVRGCVRPARGELLEPEATGHGMLFRYRGLDGVARSSAVSFSRTPLRDGGGALSGSAVSTSVPSGSMPFGSMPSGSMPSENVLSFPLDLPPGGTDELYVEVGAHPTPATRDRYRSTAAQARKRMRARHRRGAQVRSNAPLFDAWLQRSRADLALLVSELDTGPYPYAGIPWFSTPFGRDAVITALQVLWLNPQLARGVLGFLARHQANEESAFLDAAPGKIMHETRKGEMSALHELPFGLYYGGVDTTPLFVMLAGAYARRTGETEFIDALWPALCAATTWIERTCDRHPAGLLAYARGADSGLANQGWKDSEDSVFHADGEFPPGPIALVEVQGYAHAALQAMAVLAAQRGEDAAAERWRERAERLRATVEARFWMPGSRYYGIAIDGADRLCAVRTSNPGHLLFCGLPEPARAAAVASHLLGQDFHTGWGLRTLARGEPRFNPMSYHNGSIWPHDTALCAAGIARYGHRDGAVRLLSAMFESATHFDLRLPELFCGFDRAQGAPPVAYPVACLPQAWAATSPFLLLQACLGVEVDGAAGEILVHRPQLPQGIDEVRVQRVEVRGEQVDLLFRRSGERVGMFVEGRGAGRVTVRLRG